ncbi:glycosyltransferase family 2 protein [Streptosporangium sp. NPDC000396]|uniref:glycosyltransferase family 2 protein n=1 Tax=Streptosporangium sp. NPDC000396 TaxID=3366185 RepID=UPI0036C47308
MTAGPDISVVVPVYNTAKWLGEALHSIDRQGCRSRAEVILIDDGATDESPRIAREYASRTPGACYARQDHAGPGAARNHGLRLATGRYVAFLDSDDLYVEGGLDTLLRLAVSKDVDIVVGDIQGMPPRPSPVWRRELLMGERLITSLGDAPDLVGNPSACNKVFRRGFLTDTGARFVEGTAFEDVLFTVPLLTRARRIMLWPHVVYLYRTRNDGSSIMDSRDQPTKIMQHLTVVERLAAETAQCDEAVRNAITRWIVYMQLRYARQASRILGERDFTEFCARMRALFETVRPETAAEFVGTLGAGIQAMAVCEGEETLIRRPVHSGALRVLGKRIYADHPRLGRYRDLLQVRPFSMTVKGVGRAKRDKLVVRGSGSAPGWAPPAGEICHDILLEAGEALLRSPVTITKSAKGRFEWSCALPVGLPLGVTVLRMVVRDRTGTETSVPLESAGAAPIPVGGRRWLSLSGEDEQPYLTVAGGLATHVTNDVARMLRAARRGGARKLRRLRTALKARPGVPA